MPAPMTNAERYRTYGESRVDMYEQFYQEEYARALAEHKDETSARKIALEATQREMLQAQKDLADLNEQLLKTSAGSSRANLDRFQLLSTGLRAADLILSGQNSSAERRQREKDRIEKSYSSDDSIKRAADEWAISEKTASKNGQRTNAKTLDAFRVAVQDAAPSMGSSNQATARSNARAYIDAGMKAGLTEAQATEAVSDYTKIPASQLSRDSIDADKQAAMNNLGQFDVAANSFANDAISFARDALLSNGATKEQKDAAVALANLYLNGSKVVQVEDGITLDDAGNEVPKFKTEVVDDDTYAKMQKALADGTFDQADMDALGLTAEDYQRHLDVGRIIEKAPSEFSASDRGNFSGAKMELLKKQAALSEQLKSLKDNVPEMASEKELRARAIERAEPYQKVAPGEGLRLALGIQPRSLRPIAKATDGSMQLTNEQQIMLGAAKMARAAGFKPGKAEEDWANAIYAAKAKGNGSYQKGDAFKRAVEMSGGDNAKRDSLLAALAYLEINKAAAQKPTEPSAAKPASTTPAGVLNDNSNFMMGSTDGGNSPRLEALLRKVVNPSAIPYDNRKGTETPYKPVGAPIVPRISPTPGPAPVAPMGQTSDAHDLLVLPKGNGRIPPIDTGDEDFNSDINIVPTFEDMQALSPGMTQEEYDAYIKKNYGSK